MGTLPTGHQDSGTEIFLADFAQCGRVIDLGIEPMPHAR